MSYLYRWRCPTSFFFSFNQKGMINPDPETCWNIQEWIEIQFYLKQYNTMTRVPYLNGYCL